MIIGMPSEWKFCDDGKNMFFEVFTHIKSSSSLNDTTKSMEYPREEWHDAIENQKEYEIIPEIGAPDLKRIENLSKDIWLDKYKYIWDDKEVDCKDKWHSLFSSKTPTLNNKIDIRIFHETRVE